MTPDDFATALKHQMHIFKISLNGLSAVTNVDRTTIWRMTKGLPVSSHAFLRVFTWLLEKSKEES